jgi:lipopolysaccharide export system permease protein
MRLHDRYLFRELLTPLAYCLGFFLVFGVAFDGFSKLSDLQERKLHGWEIVTYVAMDTPAYLVQILPIALLLALLYALTQHARHNEITALRAAGISLWRLCVPYFVVGLAATAVMFWLDEGLVPYCNEQAAATLRLHVQLDGDSAEQRNLHDFSFYSGDGQRFWFIGDYHPTPPEHQVRVSWPRPDGSWQLVQADTADFTNGCWHFYGVNEYRQAGRTEPLVRLLHTNELILPGLTETPREIRSEVKIAPMLAMGGSRMPDIPLKDLFSYLRLHPNLKGSDSKQAAWVKTKFHGRLAAPFTCLVVVLIAIPFGAPSGRRNLFFGVAGSIFLCFAYFLTETTTFSLGLGGGISGWLAAWLPNIIFGTLGIILTLRVR